jgi:predicted amidohydrolase YtcJ
MAAARDRLGLVPEERLDAAAALDLFTRGAAEACGLDRDLAVGSGASLTILDTDPLRATPDELRRARVLGTVVDGDPVQVPDDVMAWQA